MVFLIFACFHLFWLFAILICKEMARDEQQLLLIVAGVYLAFLEDDSDEEDNNDNSPVVKRLKQEIHDSSLANTLVADSILRQPGRGFLEAGKFLNLQDVIRSQPPRNINGGDNSGKCTR